MPLLELGLGLRVRRGGRRLAGTRSPASGMVAVLACAGLSRRCRSQRWVDCDIQLPRSCAPSPAQLRSESMPTAEGEAELLAAGI